MKRRKRGFTLIEMMIVVVILSILAGILLPKVRDFRSRAISAKAIGAMSVVRTAAYQYNEGTGSWPPSGARGVIPAGLGAYLPAGFTFRQTPNFDLMWRRQNIVVGGRTTTQQMVLIYPSTAILCARIASQLGGSRNPDLVIACSGATTTVTLYVDR